MLALDTCTAAVDTAAQTAGNSNLRSIMVVIESSQVGVVRTRGALATLATQNRSHHRVELCLYEYIYIFHI